MTRVLVTTAPFCEWDRRPIDLLDSSGSDYLINPIGRRLQEDELIEMIGDAEIIIAGTEPITERVMAAAPNLKVISRVGVGLDSVDLLEARRRGIYVSYTPNAPTPAVADLTIGLMLMLLRHVQLANADMHQGKWIRRMGRRISSVTIGIVGTGRIGSKVLRQLADFNPNRVLVNDLIPETCSVEGLQLEWVDKETIYREADVISLHVPLTPQTANMITMEQLLMMKQDALLLNTARGGLINENDLANVLSSGHLSGAAVDVFREEPYLGPLSGLEKCVLTSHMGSMSDDCRAQMEIEATEEAVRYLAGQSLQRSVPEYEYAVRSNGYLRT